MDIEVSTPAALGPADMLARQRLALQQDGAPGLDQRLGALAALDRLVRTNKIPIAQAISADFGHRATEETLLGEVMPLLSALRHTRKNLARWMRRERRQVGLASQPGRAWVTYHPLGCVGIIAPWNYPLLLTLGPLVNMLAAGNRVIIKPSELSAQFSTVLARLIAAAFDPAHVTVAQGGPEVAQALCALPLDHLLFTGSVQMGRRVMRAAADNLVPVTLELGGKSPVILCGDYDLATAAKTIAAAKFFNAGQTCIAPDYALVPEDQVEDFAAAIMNVARTMFPTVADNPDYTSIISARHHERLHGLLHAAEAAGAKLLRLNDSSASRRLGATVVLDPPLDGALMQEEIFGPILPVIGYPSLPEAIAFVNQRPHPLALYVFTDDPGALDAVMAGTQSGGVSINTALLHCIQDDLPFGGVGESGMGAYHGRDGFRRFSHARGVYKAGRFGGLAFLAPPYGRKMRIALKLLLSR